MCISKREYSCASSGEEDHAIHDQHGQRVRILIAMVCMRIQPPITLAMADRACGSVPGASDLRHRPVPSVLTVGTASMKGNHSEGSDLLLFPTTVSRVIDHASASVPGVRISRPRRAHVALFAVGMNMQGDMCTSGRWREDMPNLNLPARTVPRQYACTIAIVVTGTNVFRAFGTTRNSTITGES